MLKGLSRLFVPALIVIGVLVFAIGVGGLAGLAFSGASRRPPKMTAFEVKNIDTLMVSSSDGSKNAVTLDLYLELTSELAEGMNAYVARKQLRKNLAKLDYDQVMSDDGIAYVTEHIISWFADGIERDKDIGNIYVSNIVTGPISFYQSSDETDDAPEERGMDLRTQQRFNALFKTAE